MNSAILIANHPAAVMLINIVISMAAVIYINISTLITPFLFYNPFVRDYKSQYYAKKIKSLSSLDKPKKFCNSLISLALNSV